MALQDNRQNVIFFARKSSAHFAIPVTFATTPGGVKSCPIKLYTMLTRRPHH